MSGEGGGPWLDADARCLVVNSKPGSRVKPCILAALTARRGVAGGSPSLVITFLLAEARAMAIEKKSKSRNAQGQADKPPPRTGEHLGR